MNIHRIILGGIKKVVKKKSKKLHEPLLVKNEKKYLSKCIETNYVSYKGKFVEKFDFLRLGRWSLCGYFLSGYLLRAMV